MGNGGSLEGNGNHILLGILDALADSLRDLGGLTQTDANVSVSIAHDHQCREAGNTTTLDRLGYTVQADERFLQLVLARIELVSHFCFLSF